MRSEYCERSWARARSQTRSSEVGKRDVIVRYGAECDIQRVTARKDVNRQRQHVRNGDKGLSAGFAPTEIATAAPVAHPWTCAATITATIAVQQTDVYFMVLPSADPTPMLLGPVATSSVSPGRTTQRARMRHLGLDGFPRRAV